MTIALSIGFILACLLACAMAHLAAKYAKFALKCSEDALDAKRQYVAALADLELHKICLGEAKRALDEERIKPKFTPIYTADPYAKGIVLDEQTKSLVRLAVANPNDNERQSAALIVCERLKGKIDGP